MGNANRGKLTRKGAEGKVQYKSNNGYCEFDISGKIIGCAIDVFKELGYGHREKVYQNALSLAMEETGLKYQREKYGKIKYRDQIVGKYFLDFLVEGCVAVELKIRAEEYNKDLCQLLDYMVSENIKIGLLLKITKQGIKPKRLINSKRNILRNSA